MFGGFAADTSLIFPARPNPYRVVGVYCNFAIAGAASGIPELLLEDGASNVLMRFSAANNYAGPLNLILQWASAPWTVDTISAAPWSSFTLISIPFDLLVIPGMRLRLQMNGGGATSTVNSPTIVTEPRRHLTDEPAQP